MLEFLAQDEAAAGSYNDALIHMEHAINLAPAHLPRRKRFISLMTHVAEVVPSQRNPLQQRIIAESAMIEKLMPMVHPRNK